MHRVFSYNIREGELAEIKIADWTYRVRVDGGCLGRPTHLCRIHDVARK
jgi:hypothetical protein